MAITFDTTGSTNQDTSTTSIVIDITTAQTNSWVYALMVNGSSQTSVTATGWTLLLDANTTSTTVSHYTLGKRQKLAGDTTFTWSWPTNARGCIAWQSYIGLDPVKQEEQATDANHTASSASYVSPTLTPTKEGLWAVMWSHSRSTVSAETWTPDAALTERLDKCNTVSAFCPIELADSNGPVTVAAHSYTSTLSAAEAQGGAILMFMYPEYKNSLVVEKAALVRAHNW